MDANRAHGPTDVGTEPGFRAFYAANVAIVYGYLLRLCGGDAGKAEELTQDTWCELVDELALGRVERARTAWLLTVARSRYMDAWRREHRLARPVRLAWANESRWTRGNRHGPTWSTIWPGSTSTTGWCWCSVTSTSWRCPR